MLFSLPWDLRAKIWARARFLTARDALVAHLPARAGRLGTPAPYLIQARLLVNSDKIITIRRATHRCFFTSETYMVTRDKERIKVRIFEWQLGTFSHIIYSEVLERWATLEGLGTARPPEWVHTHSAARLLR